MKTKKTLESIEAIISTKYKRYEIICLFHTSKLTNKVYRTYRIRCGDITPDSLLPNYKFQNTYLDLESLVQDAMSYNYDVNDYYTS